MAGVPLAAPHRITAIRMACEVGGISWANSLRAVTPPAGRVSAGQVDRGWARMDESGKEAVARSSIEAPVGEPADAQGHRGRGC